MDRKVTRPRKSTRGLWKVLPANAGAVFDPHPETLWQRQFLNIGYRVARLASAIAVAAFYFWVIGIGAVNDRFAWNSGLDQYYATAQGSFGVDGYYDLLGRAFAQGQLNLPVEPSPQLLALPDPWSERVNRPFRLLDLALYNRHYYLYHGATPALLLFTPWYLLTRHDLPENFAAFLLSFAAYLFLAELFTTVLASLSIRLPLSLYTIFLFALGLGQSVPFLLQRAKVYEVVIAGGYFCLSAGFYFLFRRLTESNRPLLWSGLSGLFLGLAIGCRPHLGLAAVCAFALILLMPPPDPLPKLPRRIAQRIAPRRRARIPHSRHRMLPRSGSLQFRSVRQSAGVWDSLPGGRRFLSEFPSSGLPPRCRPILLAALPAESGGRVSLCPSGIAAALQCPNHRFAGRLFHSEPIASVLSLCPIVLLAPITLVWELFLSAQRQLLVGFLTALLIFVAGCILFIAGLPVASQRFEADFLPFLLLIACIGGAEVFQTLRRKTIRIAAASAVAGLLLYSIATNLALAIQGPYDQFVQASPAAYVHLAPLVQPQSSGIV